MAKSAPTLNIKPSPGYILTQPYIEDKVFKSAKEQDGMDVLSEVLSVGDEVVDSNGVLRQAPCKVGDIVYSAYSLKEFEKDFSKYRFLHFSELHGIMEVKK